MATQTFSRSLPMMLYRALDAVMPRFRRIFNEFGLTEQQWRVLRVLWEHEEIAFRELSEITLIPAPSLVGVVDRLAMQGLVARRRSDKDRRNVFVQATEKGADLHRRVRPQVAAAYAELRESIDADEWRNLIDGLEQIASLNQHQTE
ncbi:MAG: MarR family transcriptional regulator [Gammaproteobacteria bacterium]|nr:MarR family transcriptional regulator [Gammaproteobacteria bacterium]